MRESPTVPQCCQLVRSLRHNDNYSTKQRFRRTQTLRCAQEFYVPGQHEEAASGRPWVDKRFWIRDVNVRPLAAVRTEGDGCPGDLVVCAVPALTVAHGIQRVMLRGSRCLLLSSSWAGADLRQTGEAITVTSWYTGGGDKSLARPGRKQATVKEDFEFHISYL